ncbi:MAG: hypothetical protein AAGI12_15345 [Pseudomonadota bacterium]
MATYLYLVGAINTAVQLMAVYSSNDMPATKKRWATIFFVSVFWPVAWVAVVSITIRNEILGNP